MSRWRLVVAGVLAVACTPLRPASPPRQLRLTYRYQPAVLDNGLRVIVLPEARSDLILVDVRYAVGSGDDPPGKAGLAHLVEHLTYEVRAHGMEKPVLEDWLRTSSLLFNADTAWDETHYWTLAGREGLEEILGLEAKRMILCGTITPDQFDREREIVRNELRQRDSSARRIVERVQEIVYPDGHRYRRSPGGDDQQVAGLALGDVCKFVSDHYVPRNATVVIAGNVDPDRAIALAERQLGWLPDRVPAGRVPATPAKPPGGLLVDRMEVDSPAVAMAWPLPPRFSDEDTEAQVALAVLRRRVAEFAAGRAHVTSASVAVVGGEVAPLAVVLVTVSDPERAEETAQSLATELGRARDLVRHDLLHYRNRYLASILGEVESLAGRARRFVWYQEHAPEGDELIGEVARIQALRAPAVELEIATRFDPARATMLVVKPTRWEPGRPRRAAQVRYVAHTHEARGGEIHDGADEDLQGDRPLELPDKLSPFSRAQRFELENGMDVILLPFSNVPLISARIVFRAGTAHQPAGKGGVAELALSSLTPSAFTHGAVVGPELWNSGLAISMAAGADASWVQIDGLSMYADYVIEGLAHRFESGEYDDDPLEVARSALERRIGEGLHARRIGFERAYLNAVYGTLHPYGGTTLAHAGSVASIRVADLEKFRRRFSAANATLVIAGGFDADVVAEHVRFAFSDWGRGRAASAVAAPPSERTGAVHIGVVASSRPRETLELRVAYPIATPIDSRYPARLVLRALLEQRVEGVREQLGASYGVTARLSEHVAAGAHEVRGVVDAERAGDALRAVRDAFSSLRDGDVTAAEFAAARRSVVQRLLADVGETGTVIEALSFLATHGLRPTFFDILAGEVARLRLVDLQRVADADLAPDRETIVLYGSRPDLDAAFAGAGVTSVTFVK